MDPDQDKIDFLNLIESSFRLLEIERRQVFQPPTSQKTLLNQIAVVKVLASGTGNRRTKPARSRLMFLFFLCCSLYVPLVSFMLEGSF